MATKRNI